MQTVLLLWVEPPKLVGVGAEVDQSMVDRGTIESGAASGFPGPSGSYRLLPEEFCRTMVPDDPAPVFLHESYRALLEKWVNSLPDAAVEVAIVARVRDAVMQLVETRLTSDPRAISGSPTVTTTEPSSRGMTVVGRCVILQPARRLPRSMPSSPGQRILGQPDS